MPWLQQALGIPDTKLKWHVCENTMWKKKKKPADQSTTENYYILNASANGPKGIESMQKQLFKKIY